MTSHATPTPLASLQVIEFSKTHSTKNKNRAWILRRLTDVFFSVVKCLSFRVCVSAQDQLVWGDQGRLKLWEAGGYAAYTLRLWNLMAQVQIRILPLASWGALWAVCLASSCLSFFCKMRMMAQVLVSQGAGENPTSP